MQRTLASIHSLAAMLKLSFKANKMRLPLLLFCLILSMGSLACNCGYNGPFLQMAKQTKLVVLVKVKGYSNLSKTSNTPMAMQVEVLDVLKGREKRKSIIVWGDDGHLCRPYVSQ